MKLFRISKGTEGPARTTWLQIFILTYVFFVTAYTIYLRGTELFWYLGEFRLGLVLTDIGAGLILPLIPLCQLLLAVIGFTGAVFLLGSQRLGFWLTSAWSFLQIPSITVAFAPVSADVLYGTVPLNGQVFYAGYTWTSWKEYQSAFTGMTSDYVTGIGINFVGVIMLMLVWLHWLQRSPSTRISILLFSKRTASRLLKLAESGLAIALVTIVANYYISMHGAKPKVELEVAGIQSGEGIVFMASNDAMYSTIADFTINMRNKGNKDTTVSKIYFELKPFRSSSLFKMGALVPLYPLGVHRRGIGIFPEAELWSAIWEIGIRRTPFSAIRLRSDDATQAEVSVIVPMYLVEDAIIPEFSDQIVWAGQIVAETVSGERFESRLSGLSTSPRSFSEVRTPDWVLQANTALQRRLKRM